MDIKTYIAAAVVALTAACSEQPADTQVEATAAATENAVGADGAIVDESAKPAEAPKGDEKLK